MNIILFSISEINTDQTVLIKGRRFEHIKKVLSSKIGDSLRVGQINGLIGEGIVIALGNDWIELQVNLHQQPEKKIKTKLVLALPRPKVFRRALQVAVALGIEEIHLIHSLRVEKSYWQSPFVDIKEIDRQILLGLEQSGDTIKPNVLIHKRFRPFVEDVLPNILVGKKGWIAHPYAETKLFELTKQPEVILIGPEGGFIPFEIELMENNGCAGFSLGNRILKVEQCIPYVFGALAGL